MQIRPILDEVPHKGIRAIKGGKTWLDTYLDFTDYQEAAEDIHFWTGLCLLAASMRRRTWMDRGAYVLYPNLYVIIVAESARARKSVAINTGLELLKASEIQTRIIEAKITPEGLVKTMSQERKFWDGTKADAATFICADELATFFGYDHQAASRMGILLTEIYTCKKEYNHVTKTDKSIFLRNLYPTFLAATDPRNLKVLPDEAVAGFLGRTVFVSIADRKQSIAWPEKPLDAWKLEEKLKIDLARISGLKGEFVPTPQAREIFADWYNNELSKMEIHDTRTDAFLQRAHDLALKLAMLASASETNSLSVCDKHVYFGIQVVKKQFPHFQKSMSWTGSSQYTQLRMRFIDFMKRRGGKSNRSEVMRGLSVKKEDMDSIESSLMEEGTIERGKSPTKGTLYRFTKDFEERIRVGEA